MLGKELDMKMQKLPDNLKNQVFDYVDFLLNKYQTEKTPVVRNKFKFDWEGELSNIEEKFTSVELQEKASGWR
ncbi:MAG: hypothetical protein B6I38_03310 [Anaerolineaceae bacterium 4572_5.1]|nr:MAG: hypothetical protein B6I38_03310 [Anaerolineaceae bacterium 4572_5.1]RLD06250.1 MAG: DUF2281 domain-containing protein [Chloroflexota bacterium]